MKPSNETTHTVETILASLEQSVTAQLEIITPEQACQWLKNNNPINRNPSKRHIETMARDISAGRWAFNGETIKFANDGNIIDGQQRLEAVVKADRAIVMLVVRGIPEAQRARETTDNGRRRSSGDNLRMLGVTNYNLVGAALSRILSYENGGFNLSGNLPEFSMDEKISTMNRWPEVVKAAVFFHGDSRLSATRIPGSMIVTLRAITARHRPKESDAFFEQLASGLVDGANSPILVLRNMMMAERNTKVFRHSNYGLALLIKTWNAFLLGKPVRTLRMRISGDDKEQFPEIEL